ncbi:MAG: hypothetical protein LLG14_08155 [Nocardiaceae bacterium]|nr:hypothetical protein [Nocardiaceae bacterium]
MSARLLVLATIFATFTYREQTQLPAVPGGSDATLRYSTTIAERHTTQ